MRDSDCPSMHPDGREDMMYTDAYIRRVDDDDDNLHRTMRRIHESLDGLEKEYSVILVTGLSGVIPGAIYAHEKGKQLVVIRKDDDVTHGIRTEGREWLGPHSKVVILDDFIAQGHTMLRIYNKLIEFGCPKPVYTCLYRGMWHRELQLQNNSGLWLQTEEVLSRPFLYIPYISADQDGRDRRDWSELLHTEGANA